MSWDRMVGAGDTRRITARWLVCGELVLESACHLGNGNKGDRVDLPLLRDRAEGRAVAAGNVAGRGLAELRLRPVASIWRVRRGR